MQRQRVVIIGGGFAGLNAAIRLRKADVDVTLIDRRNFHLFQPLLYQVATGGLSPANIAAPLRAVLKRQSNTRVLLGEVTGIDAQAKELFIGDERVPFDWLIVAGGATNNYFGRPDWEKHAPGLKTIEEATDIRRRVLSAFEAAERFTGLGHRERYMTFVVVGGGPTGVEMAGSISELARHTLRQNFRQLDPATARIILIEGHSRILPPFPESLSAKAEESLRGMGVEVWTSAKVKDITADYVMVERGGTEYRIDTATVIWGAGVKAAPLAKVLADATGCPVDRGGRLIVGPDLCLPGCNNIFAVGDIASITSEGKPVPGVAPAAIQAGRYAADVVQQRIAGKTSVPPFVYWDKGSMATIGRNSAVAVSGWIKMSGTIAWLAWLFIHILYLVNFSNRALVLFQWFYNYLTRNRAARLITGEDIHLQKP